MYRKFIKRLLDIILSGLGIIVLSPVFIVVACLVRIKMGSPVVFNQLRPGKGEKIFKMYKFRSMTNACDEHGVRLPDEERITKFGLFLRATSLDEIPQLWNILKGDMSIIGPRPLLVAYLNRYTEEQHHRHDVRPGLFGLAGVKGRNAQSWDSKFAYDIEYVNNLNFAMDAYIFGKCIGVVLKRDGVQGEGSVTTSEFKGSK